MLNPVSGYGRKPVSFGSFNMQTLREELPKAQKEGKGIGIGYVAESNLGLEPKTDFVITKIEGKDDTTKVFDGRPMHEQWFSGYWTVYENVRPYKGFYSVMVDDKEHCDEFSLTGPVNLEKIPLKRELPVE